MGVYELCLFLIENNVRLEGMESKLDVFFALGKLTEEQYTSLIAKLPAREESPQIFIDSNDELT